jgi:hypothetical protein
VVGAALSEPTEDESEVVSNSENAAVEPVQEEATPAEEAAPEPSTRAEPEAPAASQCSALDPPIPYSTSLGSCDEAASMGRAFAHQVGLIDSPDSPGATITFVSICSALQGSEPKTYESPANYDLAVLLHNSGVCPGDLGMLIPAPGG